MVGDSERLLVVLKHHGKIFGRKRFQKVVFLLKKKHGIDFRYKFIPYNYGPYCKNLQFDINLLNLIGVIDVKPGVPYIHALSKKGKRKAEEIEQEMSETESKKLLRGMKELRGKPTADLIQEAKKLMK